MLPSISVLRAAAAMLIAMTLAACGGGDDDQPSTPDTPTPAPELRCAP